MKIIKKGKIQNNKQKFTCKKCGTIFEAESNEYVLRFDPRDKDVIYTCKCPICGDYCVLIKYNN